MSDHDAPSTLPGDLAETDILDAMRGLGGYLDISPADALAIYRLAYDHALARLGRDVPVAAIMTTRVVKATPGETALHAARTMAEARVSGLPVCQGNAVLGVLSHKDLLRLLELPAGASTASLVARLLDPAACDIGTADPAQGRTPVSSLMTSPAVVVGPDTPRSEAARLMAGRRVNRLPVVDAAGRLVGIVSRGDVARTCRGAAGGCPA